MNTFPKAEKVYGVTPVKLLVSEGKWGSAEHIHYCWHKRQESEVNDSETKETPCVPNRIMVSVPKKYFKRAVKRNLLKRRIREAYRLNKSDLSPQGVDILFSYSTKEVLEYKKIEAEVKTILLRLGKTLSS